MQQNGLDGIPEAWKSGAEEIRQHLVTLRGGALFLSPADALLLMQWMEAEVPVATILRAMERAHEARRRRPSRIPFGLGQVKRHLRALRRAAPQAEPVGGQGSAGEGPIFGALAREVLRRAAGDPHKAALRALADRLLAIAATDQDSAGRAALAALRDFRGAVWEATPPELRQRARDEARQELGELVHAVDEATAEALIEEGAREAVRAGYAWLSAATIWDVVEESAL